MKNKISRLAILVSFFAIIIMGFSTPAYIGLRDMMNPQGQFKYIWWASGNKTTESDLTGNYLTAGTTTPRINTEYDVDGNGKIDDVESIPNHWTSNDDIQLQAANNKAIDLIVSGTGTVRAQYGSEAPRVLDNFTLYNFSTPGTVSASANAQLIWTGTITGSADPHRRLEFRALLCLDVVGGNNTSYGFTIGNANQPIFPNGTSSCGTTIRSINYNICLQNLGSTTAQIIKSPTAADSQQYTAPSSLMFTKFNLSVDQPVRFWMGVPAGGTQSVGVYNIEVKETAYVPTGTGAL